jgi:PAS domain S-box-containing protein
MNDERKSRRKLIDEVQSLRARVKELERKQGRAEQTRRAPQEQFEQAMGISQRGGKDAHTVTALRAASRNIGGHDPAKEPLGKSGGFLDHLADGIYEGMIVISHDFEILSVNDRFLKEHGAKREDIIGQKCYEVTHQTSEPCEAGGFPCPLRSVLETGSPAHTEHIHRDSQNNEVIVELYAFPILGPTGGIESVVEVTHDITERKREEEAVRRLASIVESSDDAIIAKTLDGVILTWNSGAERMYGYSTDEVRGKPISILVPPDRPNEVSQIFERLMRGEKIEAFETVRMRKSGECFHVSLSISPIRDGGGKIIGASTITRDITEHKEVEEYQALTARLLEVLNRPYEGQNALSHVTARIKEFTGFEAVGIRLRGGDDFPYLVTQGFPPRFVEAENYLCARTSDGKLVRDQQGKPFLECMCGNILSGRTDVSKPFFTKGGSFWTNSTTKLLSETTEKDRLARTRNRCNTAGYESVALIPIRADEEIIGLLQLNDTRPNRFTEMMIRFLEQTASSIGMAIKRQRAEEALRESKERFRSLVETTSDWIWEVDADCVYTYGSPKVKDLLGYEPREIIGKRPFDLMPPEEAKRVAAEFDPIVAARRAFSGLENVNLHKDGRTVVLETGGVPILDASGRFCGYRGIDRDITERKRTEEALRDARDELENRVRDRTAELRETVTMLETEVRHRARVERALRETNELLERMFGDIHILLAYMDKDFNFIRVNRAYAAADGRTPKFFVGKNHFDLYPNEENEAIFREVVRTGKSYSVYEKPFVYPEHPERGVTYWDWSLQPVKNPLGDVEGLILSLLNVTDRKRAQEEVNRIFNLSVDLLCVAGTDGYFKHLNPAWERTLGYTTEELLSKPYVNFIHPEDRAETMRSVNKLASDGGPLTTLENRYRCKDGTYRRLAWTASAVLQDGLVYAVGRDITERRRLEAEVLKISEMERQRIGQDLHDTLGQVLTGVGYLSDVLQQKLAAKSLPEADSVAEIESLVNEAVDTTRSLARGLCPVRLEPEGFMGALNELASQVRDLFDVSCTFVCEKPILVHDGAVARHLYHISQEAVNNAIRHGKAKELLIRLTESNGSAVLTIKDDGVGLPRPEKRVKGMGLRIMNYRAEMIGASLDVRNDPKGGTVVRCCLKSTNEQGEESERG